MSKLDELKASVATHSAEEVQEELKQEEETSAVVPPQENEIEGEEETSTNEETPEQTSEGESEPTIEELKAQLAKSKANEENYKKGLLSLKAKKRELAKPVQEDSEEKVVDLNEEMVEKVLAKKTEKETLKEVIDPKSDLFIPELVDDENYNEIIAYLPRNVDKGSRESIHRGLKVAVAAWAFDTGKKVEKKKPNPAVALSSVATTGSSEINKNKVKVNKFTKNRQVPMTEWYK